MEKVPSHLAIILDGNRRYAKHHGLHQWEGHIAGYSNLKRVLTWCLELGIKELTLYCLSLQNLQRSKAELNFLMDMFTRGITDAATSIDIKKHQVKFRVCGRIHLLPTSLQSAIAHLQDATKCYDLHRINLCIAYGGQEEIIDAFNMIQRLGNNQTITVENFASFLYIEGSPDLVIRTGGEFRTSNFLPWQTIYSEWYFSAKTWPEFTKEDLLSAIQDYSTRDRRFGR